MTRRTFPLLLALFVVAALAAPVAAFFPRGQVSLDLRDADVRDVVWAFAKENGLNVIIGEDVAGRVTVTLRNVPIQTAFQSILDNAGLGYTQSGNILRVNTMQKIKAQREIEPLVTRIVTVNYFTSRFGETSTLGRSKGDATGREGDDLEQLRHSLKEHLSGTGGSSVTIVPRTNSLVITDIASNVDRLVRMVKELDVRSPQVLIEAKIVEVDADYSRDLGITTGVAAARTRNTVVGGTVGAEFPASGTGRSGTLPGATPTISPGASAFQFFLDNLGGGDAASLQIILSAAEQNGLARTLATPRVTTLHNKEAIISSGQRIPFTTLGSVSAQGGTNLIATVEFVDASLELAVTPHVTGDQTILMKVRASRNTADFRSTVFENPLINTREARNEVLVHDGDTIVIGGIYVDDSTRGHSGTPFLKDIPVVGHLFQRNTRDRNTQELLFLITPRIVHDPSMIRPMAAAPDSGKAATLALEAPSR